MKKQSTCYTTFDLVGDFDCKEIAKLLGLEPHEYWDKNDIRIDGKPYGFSYMALCYCDEYDVYLETQMEKTIAPLEDKVDLLLQLAQQYEISYTLCVVPSIAYVSDGVYQEVTPCISPSLRVMDFCSRVRADLDIDYNIF